MEIYLGLGTDTEDRRHNIMTAVAGLDAFFGHGYSAISEMVETEPWGFVSESRFLNAAVMYEVDVPRGTSVDAFLYDLLDGCKNIEKNMGRDISGPEYDKNGKRIYRSRVIDIDILFAGRETCCSERLTVPHKSMSDRDFVMIPLRQIASEDIKAAFPAIFGGK